MQQERQVGTPAEAGVNQVYEDVVPLARPLPAGEHTSGFPLHPAQHSSPGVRTHRPGCRATDMFVPLLRPVHEGTDRNSPRTPDQNDGDISA